MQKLLSTIVLFVIYCVPLGANDRPVRILILGDSLSAAHDIAVEEGWPHLFENNIRAIVPDATVVNASISGETTYGGVQRLPGLLDAHSPTHLIIELGGNDGLRGLDFGQSTANLREMVRFALARQIKVLLIGVRMPPNFGAVYNQRFQQIFEQIAADFPIDYLPRFLEGVAASDPALMQADGIHPTALAQPLLAEKVERSMREILSR